ncbi:MAG: PorP/SprF family type IX secretion system membrane protein [Bacteroidetes bacterium]|nr:PorP/SprF family type IX secretion system membrane protein [Bacteroidota bacterium]
MRSTILTFIVGCLMFHTSYSQDFHFSQYNENPLLINPAMAGASQSMRASIVFKDQWSSVTTPFRSYGFSFESRFKTSNWEKADKRRGMIFKKSKNRMSGGLSIYNDKAGDSKMGTLNTSLTYAMFFPLSQYSNLSFGLQGGFVQRKMDGTSLIYGAQYNGSTYDPNLPSGEYYTRQSFMYGDMSSGALYTYMRDEKSIAANDQINAQVGFSVYHLTRPQQNFLYGESDRLYRKYVFHGNLLFGVPNSKVGIAPSWLVQVQGPSKEILAGMMFKYYIKDNTKYTGFIKRSSVGIGVYYRSGDAIITSLLVELGKFAVGFSYDVNMSKLATVSKGRGGPEITLRMMTPSAFLYQRRSKAMY